MQKKGYSLSGYNIGSPNTGMLCKTLILLNTSTVYSEGRREEMLGKVLHKKSTKI